MIQLGNASAPKWFGLRVDRVDAYVDQLISFGASSTELVLHHGPSDERNERVHVQEHDWATITSTFQARNLHCNLHASLAPAFSLRRWAFEPKRLQAVYRPLLRFGAELAQRHGTTRVLVVHAANAKEKTTEQNAQATSEFLDWALEESTALGGGLNYSIELRHDGEVTRERFDTDRAMLKRFVASVGDQRVGICWDIGNDLQQSLLNKVAPAPPGASFFPLVNHVHVHGRSAFGDMHNPIGPTDVSVNRYLESLAAANYSGSVTLEIRYRLAAAQGQPMAILGRSYRLAAEALGIQRGTSPTGESRP
ncbi:hypothetical protein BH23CHL5_BH23CHL5_12630 [soil metagenome]